MCLEAMGLGLFTITSVGLIPSRILDTYSQCASFPSTTPFSTSFLLGVWKIWQYKKKTMKLRKKAGLPQLFDVDDLPDPMYDPNYVHVLTEAEQKDLHRRGCLVPIINFPAIQRLIEQRKFQYSQTWYRAHGTETHRVG